MNSKKIYCPLHGDRLNISKDFTPPDGLDPLMIRGACNTCDCYWYKAPKWSRPKNKQEVQVEFGNFL